MKTLFSYVLVALLMLNVLGYYGVFVGLQYKNSRELAHLLDNDQYDSRQTISIKVPLAVPYMGNTEYQRVDGDFEHNGEFYKLVKQKLANDTLHIICIKNETRKQISMALADYVKTFTDHANDNNSKTKTLSFIKDFIGSTLNIEPCVQGYTAVCKFTNHSMALVTSDLADVGPPPRA